jgi:hypothetical protein
VELIDTGLRVLLLAVLAGASPMAMVATIAVLTTQRGRTNALAYGIGFLLGQVVAFAVALAVGTAASELSLPSSAATVELLLGLALLAAAWAQRKPRPPRPADAPSRGKALMQRLGGVGPVTAFAVGGLLGIGGIKRLSITLVAGATVGAADLGRVEELALGVLYILISGVLVSIPVAVFVIAGSRADAWMTIAKEWVAAREQRLAFLSTGVFGVLLTVDALIRMST